MASFSSVVSVAYRFGLTILIILSMVNELYTGNGVAMIIGLVATALFNNPDGYLRPTIDIVVWIGVMAASQSYDRAVGSYVSPQWTYDSCLGWLAAVYLLLGDSQKASLIVACLALYHRDSEPAKVCAYAGLAVFLSTHAQCARAMKRVCYRLSNTLERISKKVRDIVVCDTDSSPVPPPSTDASPVPPPTLTISAVMTVADIPPSAEPSLDISAETTVADIPPSAPTGLTISGVMTVADISPSAPPQEDSTESRDTQDETTETQPPRSLSWVRGPKKSTEWLQPVRWQLRMAEAIEEEEEAANWVSTVPRLGTGAGSMRIGRLGRVSVPVVPIRDRSPSPDALLEPFTVRSPFARPARQRVRVTQPAAPAADEGTERQTEQQPVVLSPETVPANVSSPVSGPQILETDTVVAPVVWSGLSPQGEATVDDTLSPPSTPSQSTPSSPELTLEQSVHYSPEPAPSQLVPSFSPSPSPSPLPSPVIAPVVSSPPFFPSRSPSPLLSPVIAPVVSSPPFFPSPSSSLNESTPLPSAPLSPIVAPVVESAYAPTSDVPATPANMGGQYRTASPFFLSPSSSNQTTTPASSPG
ncbi:hypothetical protein GGS20DRAFT_598168 [Poronia punctata]|nr:hypothetical protein GGS20DRAFT_598168 [Poronia punctata]